MQQFTKLQGMPSTSVDEAQDLEEGESANQLRMVLSSGTLSFYLKPCRNVNARFE